MRRVLAGWSAGVAASGLLFIGSPAFAAPVYIELQESGYGSLVVGPGNGSASITSMNYGSFYIDSITAQGTPGLPEPD